MKKSELIASVAAAASVSNTDAERVLEAFGAVAQTALKEGKTVTLPGFIKMVAKERAARKGRNPKTGVALDIPAKTIVAVKVLKGLADHVA